METSPDEFEQPSRRRLLIIFRGSRTRASRKASPTSSTRFCSCASAPRSPTATVSTPSRLGERPSWVLAPVFALRLGRSVGPLAEPPDEPDRSGTVRGLLSRLGSRMLASISRYDRHRRQERAPQPRPHQRARRPASGFKPSPPIRIWFSGRNLSTTSPTRRPPYPSCSRSSPSAAAFQSALVTIDAIACNPEIARTIRDVGADYLLAAKAISRPCRPISKPLSRPPRRRTSKSPRTSTRATDALKPASSQSCARSTGSMATAGFPENCASATPAPSSRSIRGQNSRIAAASTRATPLPPAHAPRPCEAEACRGHWGIENTLHWTLDVTFQEDLSRLRKATARTTRRRREIRHQQAPNRLEPEKPATLPAKPCRKPKKPPRPMNLELRRKLASWSDKNLTQILLAPQTIRPC